MEVRPGYKQTEVGVIPDDWGVVRLGDSFEITSSTRVFQSEWRSQGVPFYRARELAALGETGAVDNDLFIDREMYEAFRLNHGVPQVGDLLVTGVGTLGKVYVVPDRSEFYFKDGNIIWFKIGGALDPAYLRQLYLTPVVTKQIAANSAGTTVGTYTISGAKKTLIPLPPTKAEQEAIAEALSDADALIESLEQLLAKKRQVKQGAMQELLTGKKRLPGFSGDWEEKRLGELAEIRSGGTPSTIRPQFWDGDVLWCTPTDITGLDGYKYLSDTSRKISQLGLKSSSAEVIPANSVVMTTRATIGECAINSVPVSTSQGFKSFIPFGNVDVEFLYYLLLTKTQDFISLCGGSTFLEIGKVQLAAFGLRIPTTRAEQSAIAAILSDMDDEITALETRLAKTRQLKQGMMQELLIGKIRLV